MKMTFEQYDALCERLKDIPNDQPGWYPSVQELNANTISQNNDYLEYLIWLTETAGHPKTEEMSEGKKMINKILRNNIELTDE